ncbi:MAG: hypothetical protein ACYC3W_12630, partial [Candidatus Nanopelagicales bacterium]
QQFFSLNTMLTLTNLQVAYEYAVKKIRLNPSAFPAYLDKSARVGGFVNPALLLNGGEVAFKELHSIDGVAFETEYDEAYTAKSLILGTDGVEGYGIDGFVSLNGNHETQPIIHWAGTDIICTNMDDAFIWVTGFAYPYFVTHGDPYEDGNAHTYAIQTMVNNYGSANLTVDPVLLYPVGLKALAIANQDYGNLAYAATLDGMTNTIISMYNMNPELYRSNFVFGSNDMTAGEL